MRSLTVIFLCTAFAASALSQSQKPKTLTPGSASAPQKSGSAAAPAKRFNEQAEWDKANAITDAAKRVAALRKFVAAFPRSTKRTNAYESISRSEVDLGNERLAAGDTQAASDFFKAAAKDAPKPVADKLFTETLAKIPPNLYFRGSRNEALEIVKILEDKVDANANQLLNIAAFYISIENGSEARRVSENVIKIDLNSPAAYQTLGLANRVDFKLKESADAYAKALELEPDSLAARRGLAEMKRSLALPDDAVALYREILAKEATNLPARTGLILALFDAGKRTDAESEMAKSLEANSGNVILLAGAAYWFAAHHEGSQAVALARKAIDSDPRFIWSHIALARGLLDQNKPLDAERTLLAARRYGNFPTLEYEIASARLAAGFYREAAEELSKSFSVKDGVIHADLGGRIPLESKNFSELVGFERRASIFAPVAADDPDNAAKLKALLEFREELSSREPRPEDAVNAAESFLRGEDKMKVHRQIFVASELLEKKIAIPKVLEIAKAAPAGLEAGVDIYHPATAVMASELYESRAIAGARGEYVNVPEVPKSTLTAILRGRVEEISGWALYQMDDTAQAAIHLKRAVSVLPVDSAWWRSSMWRLGTALVVSGKDAEGLEAYIKSYKSGGPNSVRYKSIEAVYKRVNGNTLGLEAKIGPDPSPALLSETVAEKTAPASVSEPKTLADVPVMPEPASATPGISSAPSPAPLLVEAPPAVETKIEPARDTVVKEVSKPDAGPESVQRPQTETSPADQKTPREKPKEARGDKKPAAKLKELFPPVIITIPPPGSSKRIKEAEPKTSPAPVEVKPCTLITSEETVTFENGGDIAITVWQQGNDELDGLTAVSTSPENIAVRREAIDGIKTQALFVVHLLDSKTGVYQIRFEMPCGKKEVVVKVR
jgi:tetratricopeptide (TPR) repeat protein